MILKSADENSLILGDELCSGTETTSAICIFAAGILQLHAKQASFIFATHFHELANMRTITELERLRMLHMVVAYNRADDALVYDRKLKKGPGNSMYGLEVCKALDLPVDFLELAHAIRKERVPTEKDTLNCKLSHYNSKKIKGNCEFCGAEGVDVHHLRPQEKADSNGFIESFHKNHAANLANICKACHDKCTQARTEHRRVKTSKGFNFSTRG